MIPRVIRPALPFIVLGACAAARGLGNQSAEPLKSVKLCAEPFQIPPLWRVPFQFQSFYGNSTEVIKFTPQIKFDLGMIGGDPEEVRQGVLRVKGFSINTYLAFRGIAEAYLASHPDIENPFHPIQTPLRWDPNVTLLMSLNKRQIPRKGRERMGGRLHQALSAVLIDKVDSPSGERGRITYLIDLEQVMKFGREIGGPTGGISATLVMLFADALIGKLPMMATGDALGRPTLDVEIRSHCRTIAFLEWLEVVLAGDPTIIPDVTVEQIQGIIKQRKELLRTKLKHREMNPPPPPHSEGRMKV